MKDQSPRGFSDLENKTQFSGSDKDPEKDNNLGNGRHVDQNDRDPLKWKENLKDVWADFVNLTTLHGCKKIQESHRKAVNRCIWFTILIGMGATLTYTLGYLYIRYQERPFVTVWGLKRVSEVPAPAVTFCLPTFINSVKAREYGKLYLYEKDGDRDEIKFEEAISNERTLKDSNGKQTGVGDGKTESDERPWTNSSDEIADANIAEVTSESKTVTESYDKAVKVNSDNATSALRTFTKMSDDTAEATADKVNSSEIFINDKTSFHNTSSNNSGTSRRSRNGFLSRINLELDKIKHSEYVERASFNLDDILVDGHIVRHGVSLSDDDVISNISRILSSDEQSCWLINPMNEGSRTKATWWPYDKIQLVLNLKQETYPPEILEAGLQVYLHEAHSSFWSTNAINIMPGTFTKVLFGVSHYKFLPRPFKSFGNEECVDVDDPSFVNPLKMWTQYSSGMCWLEKAHNASAKKCGCALKDELKLYNVKECSLLQYMDCFLEERDAAFFREYQATEQGSASCKRPCSYYKFEAVSTSSMAFPSANAQSSPFLKQNESKTEDVQNLLMLVINLEDNVVTTLEHVPELTLISIFGSVGGYMGLFLGASLLTLTELLEAIVMSLWILGTRVCYGYRNLRNQN